MSKGLEEMNWIKPLAILFNLLLLLLDASECSHYYLHGSRPRFYFHDPDASSSYLQTSRHINQRRKKEIQNPRPPPIFPAPRPEWGRIWPTELEFTLMKVAILDTGLLNWVGNDFQTKLPNLVDDYLENGSKSKSINNTETIINNDINPEKVYEKKEIANGKAEESRNQGLLGTGGGDDNKYNQNENIENDLVYVGNENAEQNKVDLKEDDSDDDFYSPYVADAQDVFVLRNNSAAQLEKFTPLKLTCFSLSLILIHSIFYFDSLYFFNSDQNKDAKVNF